MVRTILVPSLLLCCVYVADSCEVLKMLVVIACSGKLQLASLLLARQMAHYHFLNCEKAWFLSIK